MGFRRERRRACPTCGTHPEEWEADRFAYVAEQRHCPGDELIAMEQDNVREGAKGIRVVLVPRHIAEMHDDDRD